MYLLIYRKKYVRNVKRIIKVKIRIKKNNVGEI